MHFGWLGRATIKVWLFVCFSVFPSVISGPQVGSYYVGVEVLVGFKNLGVFVIFKSVIFEELCNSFDIVHYQAQVVLINSM